MSFFKATAPRLDKTRGEFLQTLWSAFKKCAYTELHRFSVIQIVQMITNGKVHPDVIPFLQDIPVIALPKGSHDLRPIGLQIDKWLRLTTSQKNN